MSHLTQKLDIYDKSHYFLHDTALSAITIESVSILKNAAINEITTKNITIILVPSSPNIKSAITTTNTTPLYTTKNYFELKRL